MNTIDLTLLEQPRAAQQPTYRSILIETDGFPIFLSYGRAHSVRTVTHADIALLAELHSSVGRLAAATLLPPSAKCRADLAGGGACGAA
jgi:hypothetical protein